MQINITTQYNIGDILYLQQTNGGGLRKIQILDIIFLVRSQRIIYVLNKRTDINRYNSFISAPSLRWEQYEVIAAIKHARRGNIWLTEKPPKKRKPMTETSKVRWEQAAAKIMAEWGM